MHPPGRHGRLPFDERYAVADTRIAFFGTPVATQSLGANAWALQLWRLDRPARMSFFTTGVAPNGDIETYASVHVYDCRGGALRLTLLPKATDRLDIVLGGRRIRRIDLAGRDVWQGSIPVPRGYHSRDCIFGLNAGLLLGSTVIAFDR